MLARFSTSNQGSNENNATSLEYSSSKSHPYEGLDETAQQEIRKLARTLTSQSSFLSQEKNIAQVGDPNVATAASSFFSSNQYISAADIKGVNPILLHANDPDYDESLDPRSDNFSSVRWVQNMAQICEDDLDFYKPFSLGCVWKDLSASGDSADISYQGTFSNMPMKFLKMGWRCIFQQLFYRQNGKDGQNDSKFQILKPMDGCIDPGELLVVLGRPGAGCTTLLKSISVNTHGFKLSPDTVISYNGLSNKEIKSNYRGEVVYNAESDIHIPHLTVFQTLYTVARLKTPRNRIKGVDRDTFAKHVTEVAMATYGLTHSADTKVGNDFIRGVSGGERKRVSIAEVSICGSKFQCWDNATRGLDSATALEFVKALKTQASITNTAATVAIYQCSKDAYDLFDKVCVLYDGYQIFFGNSKAAKTYFQRMGYVCPERQPTADFLTSITSPSERIKDQNMVKHGIAIPHTANEMHQYWLQSEECNQLQMEVNKHLQTDSFQKREEIRNAHIAKQSKRARPSSPYTVSFFMQVKYLLIRDFWRIRNDPSIQLFNVLSDAAMALILGSMFYNVMLSSTTTTFYFRGAAIFFAILFNAFSSLLEIFSLYETRPITEKHKTYSLYRPSADAFASTFSEVPTKLATAITFNVPYYFMVNLRRNAGAFFFYFLINVITVFVMSHLFRCIGSVAKTLPQAMVPASVLLLAFAMYTGFAIPRIQMLGWSKWISYINPLSFLFESLMINEFHGRDFTCAQFIPSGPNYVNATGDEVICSSLGAVPGNDYVSGDAFIRTNYGFEHKNKWRSLGIGLAYIIFFLCLYLLICEYNEGAKQNGEILVFPHSVIKRMNKDGVSGKIKQNPFTSSTSDAEKDIEMNNDSSVTDTRFLRDSEVAAMGSSTVAKEQSPSSSSSAFRNNSSNKSNNIELSKSQAIFHWRNLCYDIPVKKGKRRILNNVDGWVKPGTLTALVGASGAGKTTLLDCLAERTTVGLITGDVFVDGRPRDESFPRSIGYCQQQDLHLNTATVRESLRFSAYLRQTDDVSIQEKDKYVEEVIEVLDMGLYADAIVGVPGEGLNVEQRKRLTIGVELAAKPKLLVFLDEPTSGLDSQTAWSTCQLMRKLANHGQAILCTIHQPSALLIQEFDRLLFLQDGGQTVYFGELGKSCKTMIDYFEAHGAHKCPSDANPAEWMLEIVGAAPGSHASQDYFTIWRSSEEYKEIQRELNQMEQELPMRTEGSSSKEQREFATSTFYQTRLVCYRLFHQYWRTPFYLWSKFFLAIVSEIFIGFTFFKVNTSLQGLQNQMLAIFMFTVVFNPILEQYLPLFVQQRELYEARERPSRTFSWKAFIVSQIIIEIPWNILAGTLAFLVYYYPVGFYRNASYANQLHERGALFWLFACAFYVYISSMGLLVISCIEIAENAANLASLLFIMSLSFSGVLATKSVLPRFWIFMYRVSPLTYLIDALLAVGIANARIVCSQDELLRIVPPDGMACSEYMGPYIQSVGTGYLVDGNSETECQFCQFSSTNDYLATVNSSYSRRWMNYGIFSAYIVFDYCAAIFLYWLVRVPKKSKKLKK
ncbi:pdr10p [Saccharomyces arboricola H-6]|uniref:Pdr10p n=1 Tax=Saccharomyces arboricola (strain H-6 / AS 2.3317 / CBS 10644) TaxID=1160507 RepID=J8LHI7_SACAR|nr:pdr10p [Saccharomyces arboricola H-6]